MSILIKGMEMPQNCEECDVKVVCKNYWKIIREQHTRPSWCPLVHLPTPHGRLIDADAPIEVWEVRLSDGDRCSFRNIETTVSEFLLSHLMGEVPPTIIPAEGGDVQ